MYEHKIFVFVLEFDEEDEDDDEFIRKWSKDHTTLLPGSDVFLPKKKHIRWICLNTILLCLFFAELLTKAEDNFEDNLDGAFSFDSQFDQWVALIKFFLFLVPVKKVPFRGHCMMGLEL